MNIFAYSQMLVLLSSFWRIVGIIAVAAIAAFFFFAFLAGRDTKKAAKVVRNLIQKIEKSYESFVERQIANNILKNDSIEINVQKITETAMTILKPNIDALIGHINATTYSTVEVEYDAGYFDNAVSLSSEMFAKTGKSNEPMSKDDEAEFYAAFRDAIKSDLTRRMLNLESGEYLS